jgi:hypothetical protein
MVLSLMLGCRKCNKFVVGKKSALGDKTVTKTRSLGIDSRLPLLASEDVEAQKAFEDMDGSSGSQNHFL